MSRPITTESADDRLHQAVQAGLSATASIVGCGIPADGEAGCGLTTVDMATAFAVLVHFAADIGIGR